MANEITPGALAHEMNVSPKALRRFMRSLADAATKEGADPRIPRVGQGHRYTLNAADARFIRNAWAKAHAAPRKTEREIEAVAGDAIVKPATSEG